MTAFSSGVKPRSVRVKRNDVQHADDELFVVDGGQRGHAEVVVGAVDRHGNAAVLRKPPLGDGDAGQNFEPRADGRIALYGKLGADAQIAVDAVAHLNGLFKRLDVNIAGAERHGLLDDGVDQPHRGVVDDVVVLVDEVDVASRFGRIDELLVLGALQVLERVGRRLHGDDRVDEDVDLHAGHEHEIHRADVHLRYHRHGGKIERPGDGDEQHALAVARHRHELVLAQERQADVFQQRAVDFEHVHLAVRQAEEFAERRQRGYFGAVALGYHVAFDGHGKPRAVLVNALHLLALDDLLIGVVAENFVIEIHNHSLPHGAEQRRGRPHRLYGVLIVGVEIGHHL